MFRRFTLCLLQLSLSVLYCSADAPPAVAVGNVSSLDVAGNEQVRKIMETFAGRGAQADGSLPTEPRRALGQFRVREGLVVEQFSAEPDVLQPLYMSWDSKGRLWVVQYLQYQFPAGLKIVGYDQHLRAQFDRVPLPPPAGQPGADKVTIFQPPADGAPPGHFDAITGLNIASAALPGGGAIWVLNPPYLLRYPDSDGDGLPDGTPEVALSGFGIEDTHSVANSLQWGVDGWLYGAHGSTCTSSVSSAVSKNVRFEGQCIWRFHPVSRKFEVYAEGGGNTFSLDIDAKGRVFSGTNFGGTRGMHYEQGSYGVKSFGKHGPLTNPHAYGWFPHMNHEGDARRFPQAFVIYEGGLLGDAFEDHIIAPNALANTVYVSARKPDGSTFRTQDEADLLSTPDRWFRPVDAKVGPDGCVYLADWYDSRLSHVRPIDDWHKASGRIYRVRPSGEMPDLKPFDLHTAPPHELVRHLSNRNRWFRRQAALEIGWRGLTEVVPALLVKSRAADDPFALDALFALDLLERVDAELANEMLSHRDPYIRRWAVKIIGEKGHSWSACAQPLAVLAKSETHLEVRAQMLASAKRLPVSTALPMLMAVVPAFPPEETHLPLLAWWALESKCGTQFEAVAAFLAKSPELTESPVFSLALAKRLGQRLASDGEAGFLACERLLGVLVREGVRAEFLSGIVAAFEGAAFPKLPEKLVAAVQAHLAANGEGEAVAALRAGKPEAMPGAFKQVLNAKAPLQERIELVKVLSELNSEEPGATFVSLLSNGATPPGLKKAVLAAAVRFADPEIPKAILAGYEAKYAGDKSVREAALRLLAGREAWALQLLEAVEAWRVPTKHFTPEIVNLMQQHSSPVLREGVARHWKGVVGQQSLEQKTAEASRLRAVVQGGTVGDVGRGAVQFQARCAACHKMFGEGGAVGPELTGYERGNVDFWVDNIVYPSLEIREGYANYTARLRNGQVLSGMLEGQGASGVVLRDLAGQKIQVRQEDLERLEASPVSVMPEGLIGGLSDDALRDLFAYLMSKTAP